MPAQLIRHESRLFGETVSVLAGWSAFLLVLVGVINNSWAVQEIDIPAYQNPRIGRGLFGAFIDNNYGYKVETVYANTDPVGANMDPFCGRGDRPSLFATWLPIFFRERGNHNVSYIPETICCSATSVYKATRDANSNNWCELRESMAGLALIAVIFCGSGDIFTLFRTRSSRPFIICHTFAAVFGFAATVVFGSWFTQENNDVTERAIPEEDYLHGGYSFACFVTGWILSFIAAVGEIYALCSQTSAKIVFEDQIIEEATPAPPVSQAVQAGHAVIQPRHIQAVPSVLSHAETTWRTPTHATSYV